jgi:Outer membrane protein transport protein (OMPP1/FadL/TodX).
MKKLLTTTIAIIGLYTFSFAQYVDNALLFTQQNYGTTARSKAMGGAFGALGGDFSSLSINPAGIGVYQRSEFSTSVNMLNYNKTKSTYQGYSGEDDSNKFNFSNLGFVGSTPMVNSSVSGLVSLNYGIGFNKLNNFNTKFSSLC